MIEQEIKDVIHNIHHELRCTIEISDEDYHYEAVLVADSKVLALIKKVALEELRGGIGK